MGVRLIAAVAANGIVGRNGGLAWTSEQVPGDMQHFTKRTTTRPIGQSEPNAVIMGRRTWESLKESYKPLPHRRNMVLSGSGFEADGAEVFASLDEAVEAAAGVRTWIIGGPSVYAQALTKPYVDRIEISEIHEPFDGDTYFPYIPSTWSPSDRGDRGAFRVVVYSRS